MPQVTWQTPIVANTVDASAKQQVQAAPVSTATQALIDRCTQDTQRVPTVSVKKTGIERYLDGVDDGLVTNDSSLSPSPEFQTAAGAASQSADNTSNANSRNTSASQTFQSTAGAASQPTDDEPNTGAASQPTDDAPDAGSRNVLASQAANDVSNLQRSPSTRSSAKSQAPENSLITHSPQGPSNPQPESPENLLNSSRYLEASNNPHLSSSGPQPSGNLPIHNQLSNARSGTTPVADEAQAPAAHSKVTSPASDEVSKEEAAMKLKPKRATMGAAERKALKESALVKQRLLLDDVAAAMEEQDKRFEEIAEEHGVTVDRVKQLALNASPLKQKRKISDFNIALHFKSLEVNTGIPMGSRTKVAEIRELVREDEFWQAVLKEPELMQEWRDKYDDEKSEDAASKLSRVSTKAATQAASKSLALIQSQCEYAYEHSAVNTFGIMGRGSFDSKAQPAFFGCGPADGFLREKFTINIHQFMNLWDSYVTSQNALGSKALSMTAMNKDTVHMILQSLREITGVQNILMSYSRFDAAIVVPYKVKVVGWPEDIDFASPQTLTRADPTKRLHDAWKDGIAHWCKLTASEHRAAVQKLEDATNPRPQKQRSDVGGLHKRKRQSMAVVDDEESEEGGSRSSAKKSKLKSAEKSVGKKNLKAKGKGKGKEKSVQGNEGVVSSSKCPSIGRAAKSGKSLRVEESAMDPSGSDYDDNDD
ncbi:hypothetical protein BDP27DRAFT_1431880 [Rhodocollybia butyracea]|uniref:Uncharacterized protein n=1 Tax=Rhodocollybia butyracea TaxID=206335 RepID=A0A9P5PA73_9AGAR|nr:hypothetical protein BDP27DRAFT_1431880 [Rhodocollybia butyracea]